VKGIVQRLPAARAQVATSYVEKHGCAPGVDEALVWDQLAESVRMQSSLDSRDLRARMRMMWPAECGFDLLVFALCCFAASAHLTAARCCVHMRCGELASCQFLLSSG